MIHGKEEYEKLIDSSQLFTLDREKEQTAYKREALRMVENLYGYLMAVGGSKYEEYGLEIVELAKRCIDNYDPSTGRFLNYFTAAWKSEYSHRRSDNDFEDRFGGMKFSEQDKRCVKKYLRLLSRQDRFSSKEEQYAQIAEYMGISVKDVMILAETAEVHVIGENTTDSEGEEYSLIDQTSADFSLEGYFEDLASFVEILDKIQEAYDSLQERQKPIISDMLTVKIGLDIYEIEKISKEYSFISDDISKRIKQTGTIPTQRDIATKYGKNEASISRTVKEFLSKVKRGEK